MTSLSSALQQVLPVIHPADSAGTLWRKALYWIRKSPRQQKKVAGTDGVVRFVAGFSFPEAAREAISWARKRVCVVNANSQPACDVFVLGITLQDGASAYEVRIRKASGIRVKHLAVRLRKRECEVQGINVPREIHGEKFRDLLAQVGQPDFKGMRNWFWDFDTWTLKSVGTSRLAHEEVFTIVANCLAESLGVMQKFH